MYNAVHDGALDRISISPPNDLSTPGSILKQQRQIMVERTGYPLNKIFLILSLPVIYYTWSFLLHKLMVQLMYY